VPIRLPITIEIARALYEKSGGGDRSGGHRSGGHDFDHVLRVTALAERIGRAEGADLAIIRTAALLHDVGESGDRENHHLAGAAMARELLRDELPAFVAAVAHAIEAHRFRADPAPRTLEAQILSDADKLDAIGAIGVARVFAYAGARGTPLWRGPWREIARSAGPSTNLLMDSGRGSGQASEPDDANDAPKRLGGNYTPVHEFVYKLDRIPERLYTATARASAIERLAFMRAFFDRLDEEMTGQ